MASICGGEGGCLILGRVLLVLLADEVERAAETGGIARTEKMLGRGGARFAGTVETAMRLELEDGAVVADDLEGRRCLFLAALYRAEREIAEKLRTLAVGKPPWPSIDVKRAIPRVEQRTKLALADSQEAALRVALSSNVTVITGGPGVGKTTLINSLLKILIAKAVTIALCAPTGRAAKRLSESTGLEAKTIHRLLETDPRTGTFRRNEDEPLDCDLLVVDETSMVDVPLMRAVLRALPERSALLLVGDVDQLPSVGPGQVRGEPEHGFERDVPVEAPIVRMRGQPLAIAKTGALAHLYPQRLRGQTHLAGRRRGSADHDVAGQQTRKPNGDADAEPSRIGDGLFLIERPQGAADHQLGAVECAVLHLG
jgi:ATP-dependent exoDNAse (exonuclease V) alpha subunit